MKVGIFETEICPVICMSVAVEKLQGEVLYVWQTQAASLGKGVCDDNVIPTSLHSWRKSRYDQQQFEVYHVAGLFS